MHADFDFSVNYNEYERRNNQEAGALGFICLKYLPQTFAESEVDIFLRSYQ